MKRIRNATNGDLAAVEKLLSSSDLPIDGVRDNFSSFLVADNDGKIAGAVGLEQFVVVALLRSAVVSPEHRGGGIAPRLLERPPQGAHVAAIENPHLVTT